MSAFEKRLQGPSLKVKHPKALAWYGEWKGHEERRVFVQQSDLINYQKELSDFIDDVGKEIAAIKHQKLGSFRYDDSIKALEALQQHAKEKRTFFDECYVRDARASNTFAKKMNFDEQRMVPQASDLGDVKGKMDQIAGLTPSQAWALVGADKKGALSAVANMELAVRRLQEFNDKWQTTYGEKDLVDTLSYMVTTTNIASSYHLESIPTNVKRNDVSFAADQLARQSRGELPLYKLFMNSGFKNVWETGVSQASANRGERGAVEEQMGYATALRRTAGKAHDFLQEEGTGVFDPDNPSELPRYAATIDPAQNRGVALRYGTSYVVWKDSVRERSTWTPGDSWSMGAQGPQSVKNFVSMNHPELIFIHAEESLIHLFLAEATGKEPVWLSQQKQNLKTGDLGGAYIETQVHGDLTWEDVGEVVLDASLPNVQQVVEDFKAFRTASIKPLNFKVRTTADVT
jgi:hypothetical protein